MYGLILFDLDGTLLDSDQMIIETFKELYPLYRPGYNPSVLLSLALKFMRLLKKSFLMVTKLFC